MLHLSPPRSASPSPDSAPELAAFTSYWSAANCYPTTTLPRLRGCAMANFIRTETPTGEVYFLNVDRMTKIHPMKDGGTLITFDSDNTVSVSNDADEILAASASEA